ncbi:MAG: hypothetical protein HYV28_05690 [Ignavibacteriales bacterium]|nr:hypothetical protein [Ignavibacteriales bacterium]
MKKDVRVMNKIVLEFGLLVFSLSLIFFSQLGLGIGQTFLRSFVIFAVVTTMAGILALTFIRAINKASEEKGRRQADNLLGNENDE